MRGHVGALGVDDPGVLGERRGLGFKRMFGGSGNIDLPRMIQVEIRQRTRHQLGVGKTVAGILFGEFRDVDRGADGLANRLGSSVGGASRALLGADIDGDSEAPVVGELDSLQLALANRHDKARGIAGRNLRRTCTLTSSLVQDARDQILERGS